MACQQPQAHPARCGCEQESPVNELALLRLGYGNACRERDALQQRCMDLAQIRTELERMLGNARTDAGTLRAEVERLREALRRIHVRAEAHVDHGRGMPDGSTFVVEDIARTALEGSAWAVDTSGATLGA